MIACNRAQPAFFRGARAFLLCLVLFFPCFAFAASPALTYNDTNAVLGSMKEYKTRGSESLIEIARTFGVGYKAITEANPLLDPFVPGEDVPVTIPASWILPAVDSYDGIVINVSEMRLYYFTKQGDSRLVRIFPIGVGSEGHDTPVGQYRVIEKIVKPAWHVPESIREEKPELPRVVPPGPDNPLGSHALRLSSDSILIHGTNRPWGVGKRVSHGCIRLYPEHISELFPLVPAGTKVTIVRQPVKAGLRNGKAFLEVHNDEFDNDCDYLALANTLLWKKGLLKYVDTEKLYRAIEQKQGTPVDISE